jgi:excisionase family DNA binding protein
LSQGDVEHEGGLLKVVHKAAWEANQKRNASSNRSTHNASALPQPAYSDVVKNYRPSALNQPQLAPSLNFGFEPFVGCTQAAAFLGLHKKTVEKQARLGQLPAHPVCTGKKNQWRFLISELDAWLRARVFSPNHPCPAERRRTA